MVIIGIALLLGIAALIWLWKVPVSRMVKAMKKSGSSSFEAYTIIALLTGGLALAGYLIVQVI